MSQEDIQRIFMQKWDELMVKRKQYLELTDNRMGLVDDLLDEDPSIKETNYPEFFGLIDVVYSIANGLNEIDHNVDESDRTLLEQVNRIPKLPRKVADALLEASTIDEDEIISEVLDLKRLLDNNELAQEILRWGEKNRENREGGELQGPGIH